MAKEESTEEKSEETSAPEKKSNVVLIIIAVVLVLVLAIVGVVVIMLMSGGGNDSPSQNSAGTQMTKSKPMKMMDTMEVGPMYPLDTFTVNLLSDSGRRYLKVQINLELDGEELAAELESKTAVVRDVCIRLLSSKTLEEISTSKGKEKLKEQIVDQLNMRLRDGNIRHIYFTEFVVQ